MPAGDFLVLFCLRDSFSLSESLLLESESELSLLDNSEPLSLSEELDDPDGMEFEREVELERLLFPLLFELSLSLCSTGEWPDSEELFEDEESTVEELDEDEEDEDDEDDDDDEDEDEEDDEEDRERLRFFFCFNFLTLASISFSSP